MKTTIEFKINEYRLDLIIIILIPMIMFMGCRSNDANQPNKWDDYAKYDTFDEWTMQGVGKGEDSTYVYVKCGKDSISVYKSEDLSREYLYEFIDGYWYSHLGYDIDNLTNDEKSLDVKRTRIYDRYIFNDSIVEFCRHFGPNLTIGYVAYDFAKLVISRDNVSDVVISKSSYKQEYSKKSEIMERIGYNDINREFLGDIDPVPIKVRILEYKYPYCYYYMGDEYMRAKSGKYGQYGITPLLETLKYDGINVNDSNLLDTSPLYNNF